MIEASHALILNTGSWLPFPYQLASIQNGALKYYCIIQQTKQHNAGCLLSPFMASQLCH